MIESAVREIKEELGITASEEELHYVGVHHGAFEDVFTAGCSGTTSLVRSMCIRSL